MRKRNSQVVLEHQCEQRAEGEESASVAMHGCGRSRSRGGAGGTRGRRGRLECALDLPGEERGDEDGLVEEAGLEHSVQRLEHSLEHSIRQL